MQHTQPTPGETPEGAAPAGRGYWFIPLPVYLLDAVYDPDSPVNAPAAMLWAHIQRHYAWREKIFPSYARLAEETGTGERTVRRQLQVLKDAGALTWGAGFSSKGRSSNRYALAPIKPFEFDRDAPPSVTAKNGHHREEAANSGRHPLAKDGHHPPAKNGRVVKSSSYLESTDELLSPLVPAQRVEPEPAPAEREIVTLIDRPSTAQQVVRAANILTSSDDETAFITWATARYRIRSGALWRTVAANGDLVDWVAAWRAEGCQAVAHGLTGTDAAVSGWYALADQLRQEGTPSTTDQRVQAAIELGRQMQAEADARNGGGYLPRPQPTPEDYANDLGHF